MIELIRLLTTWHIPSIPSNLRKIAHKESNLIEVWGIVSQEILKEKNIEKKSELEIAISDWLYDLVKVNVKRGRVFELSEVLSTKRADCLGYAKLLNLLGRNCGLELGIVEVIVDNVGRYVPHHVNLLNLANGGYCFIDPWYGSKNIVHRRLGALVEENNGRKRVRDINFEEIQKVKSIRGLPEHCIVAIDFYIRGNGHLKRNEVDKAIKCYDEAIKLYPNNTRAYFNRAVAYEKKGESKKAKLDYKQAIRDENGIPRVLGRIDEMEWMIELDEKS